MPRHRTIQVPGSPAPVLPSITDESQLPDAGPDLDDDDEPAPAASAAPEGAAATTGTLTMEQVQSLLAEQERRFRVQMAEAIGAAKSTRDPATAAALAARRMDGDRLPTQAAALEVLHDAVARGERPRSILSVDGWVTVQAQTQSPASLGRTGTLGLADVQLADAAKG